MTLITIPEVMAETLGTFLATHSRGRFERCDLNARMHRSQPIRAFAGALGISGPLISIKDPAGAG